MGSPGGIMMAELAAAIAIFTWVFVIGWFVIYTTVGSWLKVRLIHLRLSVSVDVPKRYGPVIVSHMVYSVLFVNPWLIFYLTGRLNAEVDSVYLLLVIAILYFWLLPTGTDCLLLRLLPKWPRLKWLRYQPPLKRQILANLAVSFLVFGVTSAAGVICARIF